jgi:large repetitive protein
MSTSPWTFLAKQSAWARATVLALAIAGSASAQVKVRVVDDKGNPITTGFRWLLEEDNTYGLKKTAPDGPWAGQAVAGAPSLPGTPSPSANWDPTPGAANPTHTLSVNVHKSYAPVVCVGDTNPANAADGAIPLPDPNGQDPGTMVIDTNPTNIAGYCPGFDQRKNYFLSILPWHSTTGAGGWTMSGRNIAAFQPEAHVIVHEYPQPTAQITVLTYEDNQPINFAYDQPEEHGLGMFTLLLADPAGQALQDAFAYPIGTTYKYETCSASDSRPCRNGVPVLPGEQPNFLLDADGAPIVDFLGNATIQTCPGPTPGQNPTAGYTPYQRANCVDPYSLAPLARGEAVIRYLSMDKYSIEAVPPPRGTDCGATRPTSGPPDCSDMLLTGTFEGTRQNDAWVRATEPRFNIALGNLNWLVFYGFVHPVNLLRTTPTPRTGRITGQIVGLHDEHPPLPPGSRPGLPVPDCFVGLNNLSGNDEQVYTAPCAADSTFNITGVGPGTYELVIWDKPINAIIDFRTVTVGVGQTVDLGKVPVFSWFARLAGHVFYDVNGDGMPRGGVPVNPDLSCPASSQAGCAIPNVPINLHLSDGSMIANTVTGSDGSFSFDQYFSWWRFTVLEVGTGLGKPTGLVSVVDNGGPLPNNKYGAFGINPQTQSTGQQFRLETGEVVGASRLPGPVTEAVQLFQDMTSYVAFGLQTFNFARGENGGIRGFVDYATTRTEEDPRTSATDGWEPGVPNVTVTLYRAKQDCTAGNPISDCWVIDDSDPRFPQTTVTDSWNDNRPTDCVSDPYGGGPNKWPIPETVNGFTLPSCAETFKNWDQSRPGVFDGAFAFEVLRDKSTGQALTHPCPDNPGQTCSVPLPPGNYIVQVSPPPGFQVLFWGDRNIEFGDPKFPWLVKPPDCNGQPRAVPQFHTLYPDVQVPTDTSQSGVNWSQGLQLPGCESKVVALNPGATAQVTFNIFTMVPKASRIWGAVWNDLMLEFNTDSPNASGNLAVSYLPVSIKDWKGTEVARFYTDQHGHFDGLVPANYDIVPPIPLGLVLNMLSIMPNDPGPILDTRRGSLTEGQWITDPWYNPGYSQYVIRENWEFYPGRTTFIDTVVFPLGAFAGNRVPLNCAFTDKTPEFKEVRGVAAGQIPVVVKPGDSILILSKGIVDVANPNFDPTATSGPNSQPLIKWDHSFGPQTPSSQVTVGGTPLIINSWAADGITINATIPPGGAYGELVVTRGDNGLKTTVGIALHRAGAEPVVLVHPPSPTCTGLACAAVQPAIDSSPPGTLIVLGPGRYQENVILWKPVSLQGLGAAVTVLDGTAALSNFALKQQAANRIVALEQNGTIATPPGQASNFTLEQGAGILAAGCGNTPNCGPNSFFAGVPARVDGLTINGSDERGGGIILNGYVSGLQITNLELLANQGSIGGGIRAGEPIAPSNFNPGLVIDHNRIANNGSVFSGGGGIALYSGTDNYQITNNFICGNFSQQYGGGIGHFGLSQGPSLIESNVIVSNESFDEGGGIHVGGENAAGATALGPGAGSVIINRNLIQGNKAGDDGGGLRTRRFNGLDVANNPTDPTRWFLIDIYNNMIVNNSSADHGGGMSFDDTVRANVVSNTVARNDSTSTGSDAFGGPCAENDPIGQRCPAHEAIGGLATSNPQVGGIASIAHTAALFTALTGPGSYCAAHAAEQQCSRFSNPQLRDDIVWQNRSFYWNANANNGFGGLILASQGTSGPPLPGGYWDFAVYGLTGSPSPGPPPPWPGPGSGCTPANCLAPTYSAITNGIGAFLGSPNTNLVGVNPWPGTPNCPTNPNATPPVGPFTGPYCNYYQATSKGAALGNFVVATFTPNGVQGDYHIATSSPVVSRGGPLTPGLQELDYDNNPRVAPVDIGADQTAAPRINTAAGFFATLLNLLGIHGSGAPAVAQGTPAQLMHPVPVAQARRFESPGATAPLDSSLPFALGAARVREGASSGPISASPSSLQFGTIVAGESSLSQAVTVRNTSGTPVSITRHFFGTDDFQASINGSPWTEGSRIVPAHGSLTIRVTFSPRTVTSLKTRSLLTLDTGDPDIPSPRIALAGMAR